MRSIGIFSNTIHDKIKNWINGFTINMLGLQMERRAVGKTPKQRLQKIAVKT